MQPINDLGDPRLDIYRSLKHTNRSRRHDWFVVEGDKLVERLIASRYPVESIVAEPRLAERFRALAGPGPPIYVVERRLVEQLVGFNFHRGALACGRRLPPPEWSAALPAASQSATLVVCMHVDDPENLGSILRTAAGLGVDAVLLSPHCADPFSRRVLRVSMGTSLALPLLDCRDLTTALQRLRTEYDCPTLAATLEPGAIELRRYRAPRRWALVLGNEAHGLQPEVLAACDERLQIAMSRGTDSLNVATAAAIMLYHLRGDCQSS